MSKGKEENLPQGWFWTTVGEISEQIQYGYTASATEERIGPKFLRITDIQNNNIDWRSVPYCKIDDELKSKFLLQDGDLVFARTGSTVGKSFLIQGLIPDSVFASYLIKIRLLPKVNKKFVFYFFNSESYWEQINKSKIGIAQPNVNGTVLSQIRILFPPLQHQQKIVEEIDTQFSRLDEVIKSIKRMQKNLQKLRATTLKWACEGKIVLTEAELSRQENREYEPADILLKRIKQQRRANWENSQIERIEKSGKPSENDKWKAKYVEPISPNKNDLPEISSGWTWVRLEQICFLITDGTHQKPEYISQGIPFLSVKNVRPGVIKDEDVKYISSEQHSQYTKKWKPEKGDILYTKIGATFGFAAVNSLPYEFSIYVSLALLKFPQNLIIPKYFEICLNSEIIYQQAQRRIKGVGRPDLHLEEIRDFHFPLPPLSEQIRIVNEVERRTLIINELEKVAEMNLQRTENLRRKILQDAFAGKLVKQNPNDEPASILLEKIKNERTQRDSEPKRKGIRSPQIMKRKKVERRDIVEVLRESANKMTPEQLFHQSGFNPDEVEDFYNELKNADNDNAIEQEKEDDGSVYLTAKV